MSPPRLNANRYVLETMSRSAYIPLLLVVCFAACESAEDAAESQGSLIVSDSTLHMRFDTFEGVLFTKNYTVTCLENPSGEQRCYDVLKWSLGSESVMFWKAGIGEILQLEQALSQHYQQTKDQLGNYDDGHIPYKRLNVPIRQYIGFQDATGARHIWVNMLPPYEALDDSGPEGTSLSWLKAPILVDDGGPYYFQFRYNVETGKLYGFRYNGTA